VLNRQQIDAARDIPEEIVPCPEWGGDARIVGFSGAARDAWESDLLAAGAGHDGESVVKSRMENIRASLVARCLVDADGNRLYSDAEIAALGRKSAVVLDRLYEVASRLNKLRKSDIEELEKN